MINQPNPNKQKMIDLRGQGLSYGSIAKMTGVSRARVHQICSGYHSKDNPLLKKFILKRDNYSCQWGNICKNIEMPIEKLVIHHIDFNDRNNDPKNLITLCNLCHASFHASNHIDKKFQKNLDKNHLIRFKVCIVCGKKFHNNKRQKTCSTKCFEKRIKDYYDSKRIDPIVLKENQKQCQKLYYNKIKNTPHYKELTNKYSKKYTELNREKINEKGRADYWKDVELSRKKLREYYQKHYGKNGDRHKNKLST